MYLYMSYIVTHNSALGGDSLLHVDLLGINVLYAVIYCYFIILLLGAIVYYTWTFEVLMYLYTVLYIVTL